MKIGFIVIEYDGDDPKFFTEDECPPYWYKRTRIVYVEIEDAA